MAFVVNKTDQDGRARPQVAGPKKNQNKDGILSWDDFNTLAEYYTKVQRKGKLEKDVYERWKSILEKWWNELTMHADYNKVSGQGAKKDRQKKKNRIPTHGSGQPRSLRISCGGLSPGKLGIHQLLEPLQDLDGCSVDCTKYCAKYWEGGGDSEEIDTVRSKARCLRVGVSKTTFFLTSVSPNSKRFPPVPEVPITADSEVR
ncbi:sarcoplasmic calcium-binding proteins I [Tropilaelaps mercedesae]|uniref:Sarcoplasmic calcium-binding proteins I n=1 Tax=Tropilaelaps mercedesae TaxID=418985 RepID=A0A1V9X8M2_9ACAR|nr:sarcoplasmic calcium-binding proteins I [Tropilaelaps mercedesae]